MGSGTSGRVGRSANGSAIPTPLGGIGARSARARAAASTATRFRRLYRCRGAVEREFGRLKHDYGLAPLRVRGLAKVQLHADLTILARLAQALSRAREAMPIAA